MKKNSIYTSQHFTFGYQNVIWQKIEKKIVFLPIENLVYMHKQVCICTCSFGPKKNQLFFINYKTMNLNGALIIFLRVAQKYLKGLIFKRIPLQLLPRYYNMLGHLKFTDISSLEQPLL